MITSCSSCVQHVLRVSPSATHEVDGQHNRCLHSVLHTALQAVKPSAIVLIIHMSCGRALKASAREGSCQDNCQLTEG